MSIFQAPFLLRTEFFDKAPYFLPASIVQFSLSLAIGLGLWHRRHWARFGILAWAVALAIVYVLQAVAIVAGWINPVFPEALQIGPTRWATFAMSLLWLPIFGYVIFRFTRPDTISMFDGPAV